ncbi:retrotransposon unclassified [Plasmopara halstedii]|uniref:Retrotransposon unclassified n=1 Tax=Plasmopara halstedii TaxID=4781 RepID=A0A0P1ADR6_PLAHL|nr:retrotransposon unclassified [Plasmopara halstedii]CEG39169.1 retrotransposon unclassified [Plasmopara halstedii]|eukprot:XP_024575538.1 retrotransposon unclassified [Plasmopara halstedii]
MLDYSKQHKAYRLLNQSTKAIIISRSVTFAENAPTIKTHRQGAPSLIEVVKDDEHDQEPSDTTARASYQTPPKGPRGAPACVEEVLNERSRGAMPTHRSGTPGRDSENESYVRMARKKQAVLRYEHEFPNLRRGNFSLDDRETEHDALYCFSAEDDGESDSTFEQVQQSKYRDKWLRAMECEIQPLAQNKTWTLVDLPSDKKAIGCRWVFRIKCEPSGKILKFKARLVAKGFTQRPGVDNFEIYAPVARKESINVALVLSVQI